MLNPRGRDGQGRFAGGNTGGPGRKPRAVEQEYLQAMEGIVDSEAWAAIVRRAVTDAIGGDPRARVWLSSYLLGQPVAMAEEQSDSNVMDDFINEVARKMLETEAK